MWLRMVGEAARLLAVEIDVIHGLRAGPAPPVWCLPGDGPWAVFGWYAGGGVLAVAGGVLSIVDPVSLARGVRLEGLFAPGAVPGVMADLITRIRRSDLAGDVSVAGGPSFVFPTEQPKECTGALPIFASDAKGIESARSLVRPSNWAPGEWAELLEGWRGS